MKTYTVKTPDDLRQFEDYGKYYVPGNLELVGEFEIDKSVGVRGCIITNASILCRRSVEAGWFVKAGSFVEAGEYVHSMSYDIRAKEIITHTLPYWREYYADMPVLKKYRKLILDGNTCWDDIREAIIDGGDAQRIYELDGWHWIIRGQIGCYLGLIDSFAPPTGKAEEEEE
ncbi:MAG: hypothetical protein SVK08_00520 [Halobacteriota archaeon]|nr:hypothetical protein [Halobacteriota archaeon]